MTREQSAHILRAAAGAAHDDHVIVVGSQVILGTYDQDDLPKPAHASIEADVFFNNDPDLTKTDMVDGALGEDSPFHQMYGYYAQGVDVTTATVPHGWRERLVRFTPTAANGATGLCLEPNDLVLSKLVAGRMKDYEFVTALLDAALVQIDVLHDRAELLPEDPCASAGSSSGCTPTPCATTVSRRSPRAYSSSPSSSSPSWPCSPRCRWRPS